ncbi:arrestin domain-containing protein 17-like [Periplaneta americana]|uniref:arrestin domain-containing protein 17-like n=1 Tax=Periplaneta americana TaxID=6978 RepID=UPI0037E92151
MGLKNLELIFDNSQRTYYSGQTVSGRLIVDIDAPKNLRSITAKFKGEAECHWSERHSRQRNGKRESYTVHYRGHEQYFEQRIKLFGGAGDTEILPAGQHCYQFSMMLPNNLPSSFEGNYGYIRYTVKATLDRPWKFDHEVKAAFTVLSQVDLNLDPRNREPFKAEDSKTFCCCCCESGPLTLATHLPTRGFVPGQSVPMTIEVDNASNVKINEVCCEIIKIVTYHSQSPPKSKEDRVTVTSMIINESVEANDSKTWCRKMDIPPLPPSQLRECRIIDLEYKLKIKAKPEGLHSDLKNSFLITIGTIPLWQAPAFSQPIMPAPSAPLDMGEGIMPVPGFGTTVQPSAPSYPDMPPPSYEECTFGTTSITDSDDSQHVFGATAYNPRYPTYSIKDVPGNPGIGWAPPTYEEAVTK